MEQEEKRFAERFREELLEAEDKPRHCRIAELTAVLRLKGGRIEGDSLILIETENEALIRKVFTLLKKAFNIVVEISMYTKHRSGRVVYRIEVRDEKKKKLLTRFLSSPDLTRQCCRRAYLRGAFLASGTISDPEKSYRMEIVTKTPEDAAAVYEVMKNLSLDAKTAQRGRWYVVYLQESEQLREAIALMGAPRTVLELENIRVMRDMRGRIRRRVNCETSNLNKTVHASARQLKDIRLIEESGEWAGLTESLRETASLRKQFPDLSLTELGAMMEPPVGRSGVNHRLRKLSEIADEIRHRKL